MRVAIIWGNIGDPEPAWTAHHMFWEHALRETKDVEVTRFTWQNWQLMPTDFDLYFFIDFHPSLYRVQTTYYHPRIFWWWDSFHFSFIVPTQIINLFDRTYFAEKLVVDALPGMSKLRWLPPAYSTAIYKPLSLFKVHDWAFIGQHGPTDCVTRHGLTRTEFITKLYRNKDYHGYLNTGIHGDLLNQVYNESAILIDRTIYTNLGTRFFETIGSGGFLLANRSAVPNGMDDVATDGAHFISYDDTYDDFIEKFVWYRSHDKEREKIARTGEAYFKANHTYHHRVKAIFTDLGITS